MLEHIFKKIIHAITGTRKYYYKKLTAIANNIHNQNILEIGSGILVNGKFSYSAKHIFDSSNNFICTDVNPDFGHRILDITNFHDEEKYDVILCLNVLEHIYETERALKNLHRALKKKGVAYIAVPVHFPLHDEPHDYWRFTEHSLRRLLHMFSEVKIYHKGLRKFPFGYFLEAYK